MTDIHTILQEQKVIHCDSEIMSGAPVFVGTRVPLKTFFDYLEDEEGLSEFIEDFPHLKSQAFRIVEIVMQVFLTQEPISHVRSA